MTSRERVLKALNHQEADRVPTDLGGNQTGIHKLAYINLIKYLGIDDKDVTIMDCVQQLAKPCEQLLERFHVDTRYVAAGSAADFKFEIVKNERERKYSNSRFLIFLLQCDKIR
jgi:uroporphyrinogen decarboxylase